MICSTQTFNAYLNLAILSRQLSCAQFISLDFVQKTLVCEGLFLNEIFEKFPSLRNLVSHGSYVKN